MPTYFFHMRDDGVLVEDPDGSELADLISAVSEAKLGARSIMAEDIKIGRAVRPVSIEITDTTNQVLETITFREVLEELTEGLYAAQ
jgi:hypothetical protein